jgi:hypothetical protein
VKEVKGVKKVFVRSGVRYDYALCTNDKFLKQLISEHTSGQLKVAPEHCSDNVLKYMGKPSFDVYKRFSEKFYKLSQNAGKEQYLVPYLMSSHPGSRIEDAIELAIYLKKNKINPEQVQDFYPTPGTASTCMFYTEIDPFTEEAVYVPKTYEEKKMQRALLQFSKKENFEIVKKALHIAGREDLIGSGEDCLIWYRPLAKKGYEGAKNSDSTEKKSQIEKNVKSGRNANGRSSGNGFSTDKSGRNANGKSSGNGFSIDKSGRNARKPKINKSLNKPKRK